MVHFTTSSITIIILTYMCYVFVDPEGDIEKKVVIGERRGAFILYRIRIKSE